MATFEEKWQEIELLETEARAAAKFMSTKEYPWEFYLAETGFYKIRPVGISAADSIVTFVENLFPETSMVSR